MKNQKEYAPNVVLKILLRRATAEDAVSALEKIMSSEFDPDDVEVGENDGIIVVVGFVVGGIMGVLSNPQDPVFGFFVIGFIIAGVVWMIGTKSGRQFVTVIYEQQQQQQQSVVGKKEKGPQRTCSHCGLQNPKVNNFCHDCGREFESEESVSSNSQATISELRDKYVSGEINEEDFDERVGELLGKNE